jgi:hypothetical protein
MSTDHTTYAENIDAHGEPAHTDAADAEMSARDTAIATVATVGVVAVGAVIFEAALIPGLALGVVAALAPQYAPKLGSALTPLFKSTMRGAYRLGRNSREVFSEVQEHFGDIAAEVSAEHANGAAPAPEPAVHAEPAAHSAEPVRH